MRSKEPNELLLDLQNLVDRQATEEYVNKVYEILMHGMIREERQGKRSLISLKNPRNTQILNEIFLLDFPNDYSLLSYFLRHQFFINLITNLSKDSRTLCHFYNLEDAIVINGLSRFEFLSIASEIWLPSDIKDLAADMETAEYFRPSEQVEPVIDWWEPSKTREHRVTLCPKPFQLTPRRFPKGGPRLPCKQKFLEFPTRKFWVSEPSPISSKSGFSSVEEKPVKPRKAPKPEDVFSKLAISWKFVRDTREDCGHSFVTDHVSFSSAALPAPLYQRMEPVNCQHCGEQSKALTLIHECPPVKIHFTGKTFPRVDYPDTLECPCPTKSGKATRFCEFTRLYYCRDCHLNDLRMIPHLIIRYSNFNLFPVSKLAATFLDGVFDIKYLQEADLRQTESLQKYSLQKSRMWQIFKQMERCPEVSPEIIENLEKCMFLHSSSLSLGDLYHLKLAEKNSSNILSFQLELEVECLRHTQSCHDCGLRTAIVCALCETGCPLYTNFFDGWRCPQCQRSYHLKCFQMAGRACSFCVS